MSNRQWLWPCCYEWICYSNCVWCSTTTTSRCFTRIELTYFTRTEGAVVRVPLFALILWHSVVDTALVALALLKFFDPLLCFLELKINITSCKHKELYSLFSVLLKFIHYFVFEFVNGSWKIKTSKNYENIYLYTKGNHNLSEINA